MNRFPVLARVLVAIAALGLLAGACGDDDDAADTPPADSSGDAVTIADAWSRQPADGQTATAVYVVVTNPTDTDVQILSASSPVTDTAELHITMMDDDGVMSMQQVEEGFVVPAGGEFAFEPGGPHVMLLGIDPATYPSSVDVTFELDNGEQLSFAAEVRDSGDTDMDMDDDMEMDES